MARKPVLDDFIGTHKLDQKSGLSVVTAADISQLKSAGYFVEDLLDHLTTRYNSLLHGSRVDIHDPSLMQNGEGEVFGTDLAGIALMRAIVSNRRLIRPGLVYPYFVNADHPLEVKIYGINEETIGENGFIYVINQREGFENTPKGSWQYLRTGMDVPIVAKIPVERADFTYPIFDMTRNVRIQ